MCGFRLSGLKASDLRLKAQPLPLGVSFWCKRRPGAWASARIIGGVLTCLGVSRVASGLLLRTTLNLHP